MKTQLVVPEPPMLSVAKRARALDLIGAGLPGRLQVRVEQLAHAGGADGMAAADEPARRIDRQLAVERDDALLDRLPRLARRGQAEVIDGHVLGGREAVVGLDAVERPAVGDAGAAKASTIAWRVCGSTYG